MEFFIFCIALVSVIPGVVIWHNTRVRRAKAKAERKVVSNHLVGSAIDVRYDHDPRQLQTTAQYIDPILQQRILSQPVKKKVQQNEAQGNYLVFAELERLERKLKQTRSLSEKATLLAAKRAIEAILKK